MSKNIARNLLLRNPYTCVVVKNHITIMLSEKRGVLPLIEFIQNYPHMKGCDLADKVIGKATALLCVKAGFKSVYGHTMSHEAIEILKKHDILIGFEHQVPYIKNRDQTGKCPMEGLAEGVGSPEQMYQKLVDWLAQRSLA